VTGVPPRLPGPDEAPATPDDILRSVERRVLWLSTAIVHHAIESAEVRVAEPVPAVGPDCGRNPPRLPGMGERT
jgi:hypothetical protein